MITRSRWPLLALMLVVSLALPVANARLLEHVASEHAPSDRVGHAHEHGHRHGHGHAHDEGAPDAPGPDAPDPGTHAHRLAPDATAARASSASRVAVPGVIIRLRSCEPGIAPAASSWPAPEVFEPPPMGHGRRSVLLL